MLFFFFQIQVSFIFASNTSCLGYLCPPLSLLLCNLRDREVSASIFSYFGFFARWGETWILKIGECWSSPTVVHRPLKLTDFFPLSPVFWSLSLDTSTVLWLLAQPKAEKFQSSILLPKMSWQLFTDLSSDLIQKSSRNWKWRER